MTAMRTTVICCLMLTVIAGAASAELAFPGACACTPWQTTNGDFCLGAYREGCLVWLYCMENSKTGDTAAGSDIQEFKLVEDFPWQEGAACECDFLNPEIAHADHSTLPDPPVCGGCGCPSDYSVLVYEIPISAVADGHYAGNLLHNGLYYLRATGRATFTSGQSCDNTVYEPSEGYLEFESMPDIELSNLVVRTYSTVPRFLVWNGTAVNVPVRLQDDDSGLDTTDIYLKVYPMGPGALGDPIREVKLDTLGTDVGTTYSHTYHWDGRTNSLTDAPYGLYVYDIMAEHKQGGYFDVLQTAPPPPVLRNQEGDMLGDWHCTIGEGDVVDGEHGVGSRQQSARHRGQERREGMLVSQHIRRQLLAEQSRHQLQGNGLLRAGPCGLRYRWHSSDPAR